MAKHVRKCVSTQEVLLRTCQVWKNPLWIGTLITDVEISSAGRPLKQQWIWTWDVWFPVPNHDFFSGKVWEAKRKSVFTASEIPIGRSNNFWNMQVAQRDFLFHFSCPPTQIFLYHLIVSIKSHIILSGHIFWSNTFSFKEVC